MLHLSTHVRYYFYNQIVDMSKGCYGLCGIVQNELEKIFYWAMCLYSSTSGAIK